MGVIKRFIEIIYIVIVALLKKILMIIKRLLHFVITAVKFILRMALKLILIAGRGVQKIHYFISQTFLYNITVSFAIIMAILYILFKVAPHTGFAIVSGDYESVSFETSAESVVVHNPKPTDTIIRTEGKLYLENYQLICNGKTYNQSEEDTVILVGEYQLYLNESQQMQFEQWQHDNEDQDAIYNGISIAAFTTGENEHYSLDSVRSIKGNREYNDYLSIEDFGDVFEYAFNRNSWKWAGKIKNRTLHLEYDTYSILGEQILNISNSIIDISGLDYCVRPLSEECYFMVGNDKEESIPITEDFQIFHQSYQPGVRGLIIMTGTCELEDKYNDLNDLIIRVESSEGLLLQATGECKFIYGSVPTEYELNDRRLELISNQGTLDFELGEIDNYKHLSVNGEVTDVFISGSSLFPSFGYWYRNNIYIVPLTIVSTVFAGVTLMQASRKSKTQKKDSDGNNNQSSERTINVPTVVIKIEKGLDVSVLNNENDRVEEEIDEHAECAD